MVTSSFWQIIRYPKLIKSTSKFSKQIGTSPLLYNLGQFGRSER
jgi:hypothetical protein